jgi:hypothetical protein
MENPAKIMKKQNELNARESFITILKSLTDIEYNAELKSPDEINRRTPDVDFVLVSRIDEKDRIAVEHTIIESFDKQIRYVKKWRDIVCSVNAGCRQRIPPDRYYFLAAPPIIVDSLDEKSRVRFVSYLSSWVMETAPKQLLVDSYIQTEYEGHKITLICSGDHAHLNGNVWGMPQEPEDQKALQSERLRRAVETKVPKLTKYKERGGFKTALLLEDVAGTLRGSTLRGYECLEEVDYVVVFVSNEDKMIIGNVWKERSVWYSSVPGNRRFPQTGNLHR